MDVCPCGGSDPASLDAPVATHRLGAESYSGECTAAAIPAFMLVLTAVEIWKASPQ